MEKTEEIQIEALNRAVINGEITWLCECIRYCIQYLLGHTAGEYILPEPEEKVEKGTYYQNFIDECRLTKEERLVMLLALARRFNHEIIDTIKTYYKKKSDNFSSLGGKLIPHNGLFIPTIKTALTVLGGPRLDNQLKYTHIFTNEGSLCKKEIIRDIYLEEGFLNYEEELAIGREAYTRITSGEDVHYEFSSSFPATELKTRLEWKDLVLSENTRTGLEELVAWLTHEEQLKSRYENLQHMAEGHKALFWGEPGTGKTLTAALLGKRFNKPVYRIDLSRLVSKYVGETEKNLETIFNHAANRNWILFFDEADGLFSSRTQVSTSNDRFANQETSYLLQRIETCSNLIILATNLRYNIDSAFRRRFQTICHFPKPAEKERLVLWQGIMPDDLKFESTISIEEIAKNFDISGGHIANVVRYSAIMAMSNETEGIITEEILLKGLRKEYGKLGRTF